MNKLVFAVVMSLAFVAHADGPWIGVGLGVGSFGGTKITSAIPGSPGAAAGLKPGDEILSIDDVATPDAPTVVRNVLKGGVGHKARLHVVDGKGHTRKLELTYAEKPDRETMQHDSLMGRPAPDFQPTVLTGAKVGKLSSLRGQVVVLDFFATWCGPCLDAAPHLEALHRKWKDKGLVVLGVSHEEKDVVAGAAEKFHVSYPIAADPDAKDTGAYQVFALPTVVVVDKQGVVRSVSIADSDAVEAAVNAALKAK